MSIQGGEVIFITYSEEYPLPDNGEFYMVFEGKNQRHVTTAQHINAYTVRAVVPGKDVTSFCQHLDSHLALIKLQ